MNQKAIFSAGMLAAARAVFDSTDIILAYAYGSRVRGDPRPQSDLDVGYYLCDFRSHPPLSIAEEMALADKLSDIFGVEVDLRDLGGAPLEWRGRVLEDGVRLYCRDETQRVNIERDLLSQYLDQKDSFRRMHEIRLAAIAESGL